jgi:transcriptional regulator of arginine metabolism
LAKEPTPSGHKYVAPEARAAGYSPHARAFRDGILGVQAAGNMLVIHTHTGMAASVGVAFDSMSFPGVLGSVSGDDTIIAVVKTEKQAADLAVRLAP